MPARANLDQDVRAQYLDRRAGNIQSNGGLFLGKPLRVGTTHRHTGDTVVATRENLGIEIRDIRMIENDAGRVALGCQPDIGTRRGGTDGTEEQTILEADSLRTGPAISPRPWDPPEHSGSRGRAEGGKARNHSPGVCRERAVAISPDDHRERLGVRDTASSSDRSLDVPACLHGLLGTRGTRADMLGEHPQVRDDRVTRGERSFYRRPGFPSAHEDAASSCCRDSAARSRLDASHAGR